MKLRRFAIAAALAAVTALSAAGCGGMVQNSKKNFADQIKERGDYRISVIWVDKTSGTCQIKGSEGQGTSLHLMPSDKAPRTYGSNVCRSGKPTLYLLRNSGNLELTYEVTYTVTKKTDQPDGTCNVDLTSKGGDWPATTAEISGLLGKCGKTKVGGSYVLKQTARSN